MSRRRPMMVSFLAIGLTAGLAVSAAPALAVGLRSAAADGAVAASPSVRHLYRVDDLTRGTSPRHVAALTSTAFWSGQWAATRLGAPGIWGTARGTGVTVAVVDTGVDGRHPDLAGSVLSGATFVGGRSVSVGNGWEDLSGHGTFIAGLIAARDSTGSGVAGLAPGAKILPVKVFAPDGSADEVDIAHGVLWAASHGARVINLSLGSADRDTILADAITAVTRRGVLVVASAGNAGSLCAARADPAECGDPPMYPAADPGVLGVGATDSDDSHPIWSETGSSVDLVAPGVQIGSTTPKGHYSTGEGTSFSAPFVSAAAALLVERAPRMSAAQIEGFLLTSATDLGVRGPDNSFGWGLVAPASALDAAARGDVALPETAAVSLRGLPARAVYGQVISLSARASLAGRGVPGLRVELWKRSAASAEWTVAAAPAVLADGGSTAFRLVARLPGQYVLAAYQPGRSTALELSPSAAPSGGSLAVLPRLTVIPPARGRVALVRGTVASPAPAGTTLTLQQLVAGRWLPVAVVRASATGAFAFPGRAVGTVTGVYRVVVAPSGGLGGVASGAVYARR